MSDGLLVAASPVEIEAEAEEAGLAPDARAATQRLFHALTSRIELGSLELDRAEGEAWPQHRFYCGPSDGAVAALLRRLRAAHEAAEVPPDAAPGGPAADVLFTVAEDAGRTGVLVACVDGATLRQVAGTIEAG